MRLSNMRDVAASAAPDVHFVDDFAIAVCLVCGYGDLLVKARLVTGLPQTVSGSLGD